jgi:hypothetical protein
MRGSEVIGRGDPSHPVMGQLIDRSPTRVDYRRAMALMTRAVFMVGSLLVTFFAVVPAVQAAPARVRVFVINTWNARNPDSQFSLDRAASRQ